MTTRGIREIPTSIDPYVRDFLVDLQEQVKALRGTQSPLPQVTNFKVTPQAFGNLLQWTRTPAAEFYEVLWNTTPQAATANIQGVGDSAAWFDNIGQVGVTRYYWIRPRRYAGAGGLLSPGIKGTTLAAATGVTPPPPPPPSRIIVIDTQTGHQLPYVLGRKFSRSL